MSEQVPELKVMKKAKILFSRIFQKEILNNIVINKVFTSTWIKRNEGSKNVIFKNFLKGNNNIVINKVLTVNT